MIVRTVPDGLLLITQPDHAHLAGRIMEHCVPLRSRPQRASILRAIAQHDNGWAEEDAAPAVEPASGAVIDFINAPIEVRQIVWPRAISRLADDPWAAALVAHHAATVYDRFRGDAAWTPFFTEMEARRDALMRESGGAPDDLVADYAFVRLADLISLTFCLGWTDEQRFGEWAIQLDGTRVGVTPEAFGGVTILLEVPARKIPNRPYRSGTELRAALGAAHVLTLRGSCSGRSC